MTADRVQDGTPLGFGGIPLDELIYIDPKKKDYLKKQIFR